MITAECNCPLSTNGMPLEQLMMGYMMTDFKQLLIPTDFSPGATEAAKYVRDLGEKYRAQIHALYVLEPIVLPPFPGESLPDSFYSERETNARREMQDWLATAQLGRSQVKSVLATGHPVEKIVEYAQQHEIDLIVMGTHGRTGLSHAIIGSVAERVVRNSMCPVLTVRPKLT